MWLELLQLTGPTDAALGCVPEAQHQTFNCMSCLSYVDCAYLSLLQVAEEVSNNKLSYVVLRGNESVLMSDAMERRSWWKAVEKGSPNNFWWGGNGQRFGWPDFQKGKSVADAERRPALLQRKLALDIHLMVL